MNLTDNQIIHLGHLQQANTSTVRSALLTSMRWIADLVWHRFKDNEAEASSQDEL